MPFSMLSFDVEDWFQVENLSAKIHRDSWDCQELRVEENIQRILQLLSDQQTKATFFILGWIADRCPALVKSIAAEGHEVSSHGYHHRLIRDLSKKEFEEDVCRSKSLLEDLTGQEVIGYRAPSFSITAWAIPVLKQTGFLYDSSYFPATYHDRYGTLGIPENGSIIESLSEGFYEVKIPCLNFMGSSIPWGGGGYFRLYPFRIYRAGVKRILKEKGDFLFYLHPWELDSLQPKIEGIKRSYYFRHYYGLERTEKKLRRLLEVFRFAPIRTILKERVDVKAFGNASISSDLVSGCWRRSDLP